MIFFKHADYITVTLRVYFPDQKRSEQAQSTWHLESYEESSLILHRSLISTLSLFSISSP